ncbi:MAG TPA: sodium:proton antiporter [Devosia sp.]
MLDIAALLLVGASLAGWVNERFLHLPLTVGLVLFGLLSSAALAFLEAIFPGEVLFEAAVRSLLRLDFSRLVFEGFLAFLLFAGALDADVPSFRRNAGRVLYLAVPGTVLSTLIIGFAFYAIMNAMAVPMSLPWALVFGALISPTDPIAVLAALKDVDLDERARTVSKAESLSNDGVGIVLFTFLLGMASGSETFNLGSAARDLVREAGGGVLLGLATGYLAYRATRAIDNFGIEVMITLALVTGTYALADRLGFSGPLATVAAGLLIGHRAHKDAMSDRTQHYVSALWKIIDEVLNAVLFLLIGLEVLIVEPSPAHWIAALVAIPIALVARGAAVWLPVVLPLGSAFEARYAAFLTWAGVRGGISVALALSLPDSSMRATILAATYGVVIFTLTVQMLTLQPLSRRLGLVTSRRKDGG